VLFGLTRTLGSLARSPIAAALHEARQMARHHLQAGGNVASARGHLDDQPAGDFVLPPDIDPAEVASAIGAHLSGGRRSRPGHGNIRMAFRPAPGGKVVVPAAVLQRLGDGAIDRGKRVLGTIISEIRAKRALMGSWRASVRSTTPSQT